MSRPVALLTDFGPGSVYVGQLHAVLARRTPESRVLDLAHDVPAGDVEAAAYLLEAGLPHLPEEVVTVVVVDPGVGTDRGILAADVGRRAFVGPDNGVLADAVAGGTVHRVAAEPWFGPDVSSTFHGRDVMAPVAAALAAGGDAASMGPSTTPLPRAGSATEAPDGTVRGRVLLVDRFGTLVTNVPGRLVTPRKRRSVRVGSEVIEGLVRTFGDVDRGALLAYIGSGGRLEIAVNGGRASDRLGVGVGAVVEVESAA